MSTPTHNAVTSAASRRINDVFSDTTVTSQVTYESLGEIVKEANMLRERLVAGGGVTISE